MKKSWIKALIMFSIIVTFTDGTVEKYDYERASIINPVLVLYNGSLGKDGKTAPGQSMSINMAVIKTIEGIPNTVDNKPVWGPKAK